MKTKKRTLFINLLANIIALIYFCKVLETQRNQLKVTEYLRLYKNKA